MSYSDGKVTSDPTEIQRLRTLIIDTIYSLEIVVLPALIPLCQHANDDNQDQRMALMEVRNVLAWLKPHGRSHLPGCDCPNPSPYALCRDKPDSGRGGPDAD